MKEVFEDEDGNCHKFQEKDCDEKLKAEADKRNGNTQDPFAPGRRLADTGAKPEDEDEKGEEETTDKEPAATDAPVAAGDDDEVKECKLLAAKCFCDVAEEVTSMKDPDINTALGGCCETFSDAASHPVVGQLASASADMCNEFVDNMTVMMKEVNKNCSKGELPDADNLPMFEGALAGGG